MAQPEVTVEEGVLRGSIATDLRGENFYKFQGIPYAKPPVNELRFKAPQPPDKWNGVLDATKHRDICYHKDPLKKWATAGSEDCLFLNVYTKQLPGDGAQKPRPVLFWIHGGGFFFGSGNEELYGPDFLITEDVVVVTINYRLGLFGFLSLEDSSLGISGNAGLKDQVMALKWVQKNISHFGGDPTNVTIFGESAGAASVHLVVLSPLAKGLFHRAILQSGCAINPWAQGTKSTQVLSKVLEETDEETLYKILMEKSTKEVLEIQDKMLLYSPPSQPRPFGFVVEKKSPGAFLDEDPLKLMSSGRYNHVPLMVGYTTAEALIFELFSKGPPTVHELVPWNLGYNDEEIVPIAKKVEQYYKSDGDEYTRKINVMSDAHFIYGLQVTILTHLKTSTTPIYLYKMSIETELNFFKKFLQIKVPGVSHLDDVGYLFKHALTPEIIPDSIEDISLRRFVRLWTNFAKCANPTPDANDALLQTQWPTVGPNLNFLEIGKDLVVSSSPDAERISFWRRLYAESPAAQETA